jgi:precorrin-6x reductase
MTEQDDIEATILRNLYEAKFLSTGESNLKKIRESKEWSELIFRQVESLLINQGLIVSFPGASHRITPRLSKSAFSC